MRELEIIRIYNYSYTLSDEREEYSLNLEFHDEIVPVIGDSIIIHEELLDIPYLISLGALDNPFGRKIESHDDKDIVILLHQGDRSYLKRIYG